MNSDDAPVPARKTRTPKPLSFREKKTLEAYRTLDKPTVKEVQKKHFPSGGRRSTETCVRIVRNALRRLVAQKYLVRVGKGLYQAAP